MLHHFSLGIDEQSGKIRKGLAQLEAILIQPPEAGCAAIVLLRPAPTAVSPQIIARLDEVVGYVAGLIDAEDVQRRNRTRWYYIHPQHGFMLLSVSWMVDAADLRQPSAHIATQCVCAEAEAGSYQAFCELEPEAAGLIASPIG